MSESEAALNETNQKIEACLMEFRRKQVMFILGFYPREAAGTEREMK